jgi:hypothetical protein
MCVEPTFCLEAEAAQVVNGLVNVRDNFCDELVDFVYECAAGGTSTAARLRSRASLRSSDHVFLN